MRNKALFFLCDGIYPHVTGGMEVFNYYLVRELRTQMDVNYLSTKPFDFDKVKWFKMKYIRPIKFFYPLRLFFHCLLHPSHKHVLLNIGGEDWITDLMQSLVIRALRLKVVGVIHYGKAVPTDAPKVYKFFFNSLKHIVAVSDDIKKNYDAVYDTNCKVIHPLVPFDNTTLTRSQLRKKYDIPQNAKVVCMVGTVKGMKNPDTLLDALTHFTKEQNERHNPFALFAGGGDLIPQLEVKTKELGISNRVKFLGNVPKSNVCEILSLSDIYLIASDFEGTSVSLLEAMYNRKPIIVSRAPGLVDMLREDVDALFFETHNSIALKDCILRYLDNETLANAMGESASLRYSEKYNYQDMLNKYIQLFSE